MFQLDHPEKSIALENLAASWLAELLGHHPIHSLQAVHIERYKHHRLTTPAQRTGRPASPTTVNIELGVLARALRYGQNLGLLSGPLPHCKRVRPVKKEKRYLRPEQVEAILAAAKPDLNHPERRETTWLALLLMANLGLRRSEAFTREWSDVDFDRGVLHITHKPAIRWFVKGGRNRRGNERVIPMTPPVLAALKKRHLALNMPATGWVFPGGRHGKSSGGPQKDCIRGLKAAAKRAGVEGSVHPHLLRHAWASRLAMSGVDRKSLQVLGGWSGGRMLDEVYAHVTSPHLKAIMDGAGIG
jgi:integrase